MNEFEQSDLEKETNDPHDIFFYQNAIHYEERENAFIKSCKCVTFSPACFFYY